MTTAAAPWDLSAENATKAQISDVSVSWDKHKITFGILGYSTKLGGSKSTHLFVSDVVGSRVPTNAIVQYTTNDKKAHRVSVSIPKTVVIGSNDNLVFSIADDEKISVRKDK